jgi:uncharacterized FAD-dependent dehydrogenase
MLMNKYDIGIIGAGVAGAFSALRIAQNYPSAKTIIFDFGRPPGKRRRQLEGWFGCFPAGDGKIYSNDLEKILNLVDGRKARHANNWVMETFAQANPMKLIKDSTPNVTALKRFQEANFKLQNNDYYQWKPENIHQLSKIISDEIINTGNIEFSFDNEVSKISKKKGYFQVSSASGEYICKKIIFNVGRSGWRWANKLYKDLGISTNDDYANIGIRVEISAQYLKDFNKSHCTLTRDNLELGPFSWFGSVIPEDHADLVISNFRSNEDRWKTDKVSFSLLSSQYFKDKGCYQADRLGKLAFLLFNDRVSKEKIKLFIKGESQLCYLPEYNWLKQTLEELDKVIPGLLTRGYFYAPNILPLVSPVNLGSNLESEIENFYIAGESAGIKGIGAAALTGTIAADSACK